MIKFYRNKNPQGLKWNIIFGIAELIDSIVRIFTFGLVCTNMPITASRLGTREYLDKRITIRKKAQEASKESQ